MLNIQERKDGVTIECIVTPRASRSQIKGVRNGALAVALHSPPIEGRANAELIQLIAETLAIPRSRITIMRGETGRKKVVLIEGIRKEEATEKLNGCF